MSIAATEPLLSSCSFLVFFVTLFVLFGSMRQINLAARQLSDARKYRIVSYPSEGRIG